MTKNKNIKRGHFYSINNKSINGHRGRVVNVKKGRVKVVSITHSKKIKSKTRKKTKTEKTILLNQNPDRGDSRKAYVSKRPKYARVNQVGKHHPEMKVTDKRDKSLFRKIGKKK